MYTPILISIFCHNNDTVLIDIINVRIKANVNMIVCNICNIEELVVLYL